MSAARPQGAVDVVLPDRSKVCFEKDKHRTGPGQFLPLHASHKRSAERLLFFETCRRVNSHNSAKPAVQE